MSLIKSMRGFKDDSKVKYRFVPSEHEERAKNYLSSSMKSYESQGSY